MKRCAILLSVCFYLVLSCFSAFSQGSETLCDTTSETVQERLKDFSRNEVECLKGLGLYDLYTLVRTDLSGDDKADSIKTAVDRILVVTESIRERIKSRRSADSIAAVYLDAYQRLKQNLDWAKEDLDNYHYNGARWAPESDKPWAAIAIDSLRWSADFWKVSVGGLELCANKDCSSFIPVQPEKLAGESDCAHARSVEQASAHCESAYRYSATIRGLAYIMDEVEYTLQRASQKAVGSLYEKQHDMWNIYVEQQPILWGWEAAGNRLLRSWLDCKGYRYGEQEALDCYPVDDSDNPIGRAVLPNVRYFILHPEPTVSVLPDELDGDRTKVGLSIQWFGAMHTRVEGSRLKTPIGLSLVSLVSDNPTIDELGHGLMLNWGNLGLSVTDHEGEMVYSVTLDLLSLIKDKSDKQYIKGFLDRNH